MESLRRNNLTYLEDKESFWEKKVVGVELQIKGGGEEEEVVRQHYCIVAHTH